MSIQKRIIEISVGIFMLISAASLFMLAFKASNFSQYGTKNTFQVTALFDDVGDLKVRAPITIAGVRVGEIKSIVLDDKTMRAKVTLAIDKSENKLPTDTIAKILTAGLIGANYISLTPGYAEDYLKDNGQITETQPAMILENLVGQLIYSLKKDDKKTEK